MKYNEEHARLTKKRLLELRKEKNMSFAELSKALAEREVYISHTNLKNYEILDPEPLHSASVPTPARTSNKVRRSKRKKRKKKKEI